ncbi:VOC family protein [Candidatus Manganitrophus noduliformans]|uniref:VOC family protein n=1 Tax=Candidatus Manganitrophus noduliformans TaxID=2606439 RepID=A0A7X6DRV5_9BACT|nr:VOC family protein [Candidatus Manganitrophus noduliformans]NKE72237.1 VOC family protein [Candidatus Manganitrophus noduliformans]
MMIKRLLHTRLRVSDLNQALYFFTEVLDLQVTERHDSPRGSKLAFLSVPGGKEEIELCEYKPSGPVQVQEDLVHLAFEVNHLDAMLVYLKSKGVPITDGPTVSSSGSRFAFIEAPDKYEIELIERAR